MKTQKKIPLGTISLIFATILIGACVPKPQQRQPHEGPKDWSVKEETEAVPASTQQLNKLNLDEMETRLKASVGSESSKTMVALAPYVLNPTFVSMPENRGRQLEKAVTLFNQAFHAQLLASQNREDSHLDEWILRYEKSVFFGCSRDLKRDCLNVKLFALDALTSRIITLIAIRSDSRIEAELAKTQSPKACIEKSSVCKNLIDLRYRRLAMAFSIHLGSESDSRLSFEFMKYIRSLEHLIQSGEGIGYLSATYRSIFEILISRYKPKDVGSPEFRRFVENFNPWTHSNRRSDLFRHGSKSMFDLATRCCLYKSADRSQLSDSFIRAIHESQREGVADGTSFLGMIERLLKKEGKSRSDILSGLGMGSELAGLSQLNSDFYNEYFYVLDRLFNGHLESSEAMQILEKTNPARTEKYLLKTLRTYMRVHLAYLTEKTIDFMNDIYNSKKISSNAIFGEAIMVSRDISTEWMTTQTRLDLLDSFVGGFFKRLSIIPADYTETTRLMKSVNRNVHYLSVYPNMIGMTYFLAKNQGVVRARSWWGAEFEITPETVVESLFEGEFTQPWFRFASDPVLLSRERLFYAFHYALKTGALETFSVEEKDSNQSDRSKFFELTLGKYLDADKRALEDLYKDAEQLFLKDPRFRKLQLICNYETSDRGPRPPVLSLELLDLAKQTYVGQGSNGELGVIKHFFSGDLQTGLVNLMKRLEPKLTFARAIVALLEKHMAEADGLRSKAQTEAELAKVKA